MANSQYVFCPLCGAKLKEQMRYGAVRGICPTCGFIHFADPKVAVIGLVHHQDRVLLAKRAVDPAKGKWALPGGFMDAGEMPEAALGRELMEEVGMAIRVERLLQIFPMTGHGPVSRGIVLAYLAAQPGSAPGFGRPWTISTPWAGLGRKSCPASWLSSPPGRCWTFLRQICDPETDADHLIEPHFGENQT